MFNYAYGNLFYIILHHTTCFKALSRAMHRAFDPTTIWSAYCVPSFTTAGCKAGPYSLKIQLYVYLQTCKYRSTVVTLLWNTQALYKLTTLYLNNRINTALIRQCDIMNMVCQTTQWNTLKRSPSCEIKIIQFQKCLYKFNVLLWHLKCFWHKLSAYEAPFQ